MQIDEAPNAVEVEKTRHTDRWISYYLLTLNSFTGGLGAGIAKLPKIFLKIFRGDPISFTPFWDSFRSAVNDNPGLSDVDRFNYNPSNLFARARLVLTSHVAEYPREKTGG